MTYRAILEDLRGAIESSPFAQHTESVMSSVRPAVSISTHRAKEKDIPIGDSKFGGRPHLPKRFEWPSRDGRPLMFLAQLDLGQVPRDHFDDDLLPPSGMIFFFYDVLANASGYRAEDKGAFQVIHLDIEGVKLKRSKPPKPQKKGYHDFAIDQWHRSEPCEVDIGPSVSIAPDAVLALEEHVDASKVDELYDFHDALFTRFHGPHGNGVHRLFGHPDEIQDPPWGDCQLNFMKLFTEVLRSEGTTDMSKALRRGERDWRLLLQIDSDEAPGWMWSDVGSLYFCIREQDLRAWHLDRVWGVFQCS